MNTNVKTKWLAYLRDPKNKQTTGALRRADPATGSVIGECCLGALCSIYAKEHPEGFQFVMAHNNPDTTIQLFGRYHFSYPPNVVFEWAGIRSMDVSVASIPDHLKSVVNERAPTFLSDHPSITSLADINDDSGLTFPEIADLIEAVF